MGSTQQVVGLIPTVITIGILGKVASKFAGPKGNGFSGPKGNGFSHERSFSRLNKPDKKRL